MNGRKQAETLEQVRRILLLASGGRTASRRREEAPTEQLALPLFGGAAPVGAATLTLDAPRTADPAGREQEPLLDLVHDRIHDLGLELVMLIQMELSGLVASPVLEGRKRRRLGGRPPLRLLDEYGAVPALYEDPWTSGAPAASREDAFRRGLGRVRALTMELDLSRGQLEEIVRRLDPCVHRTAPDDDLAGFVHGHRLRHVLVRTSRGRPTFRVDRGKSRGTGVLYTPSALIEEIARSVLDPDWLDLPRNSSGDGFHLCDPACGSGQFLLAAAKRLFENSREVGRLRSLHGVDLDPQAARVAAHNLSLAAARQIDAPDPGEALDAEFGEGYPYFLGRTIMAGNSLLVEPSTFSPAFLWEHRFPEVFRRERPGFDVVVGNPPWVSFGLRDREGAGEEQRDWFERLFPSGAQYKLSLYPLFMEQALRLLRAGGRHGFLVPDSLLAGHHFSRIRERLLEECDLLELSLIESAPWPGASTGFTVFYAVQKRGAGAAAPPFVRNRVLKARPAPDRPSDRAVARVLAASRGEEPPEEPAYERIEVRVPAEQYGQGGGAPLRIFRDPEEIRFLERVERSPLRMRDVLSTYSGLIARHGQKSVQSSETPELFRLLDRRGHEVYRDADARARWRPALLSGAEVLPYRITWRGGRLYLPPLREELPKIWKSGFDLERYRPPKIFLRQTGDRLIAALDHDGFFCLNNLHVLGTRPEVGVPALLLLGVLSSEPVQRLYRIFSPEVSRPLAQVDLKIVESLPFPAWPDGEALGAAPIPARSHPHSRRLYRLIERALERSEAEPIVELFETAWRADREPMPDGPLTGREVVSLLLMRVLEAREGRALERGETALGKPNAAQATAEGWQQALLDRMVGLPFGLTQAASS